MSIMTWWWYNYNNMRGSTCLQSPFCFVSHRRLCFNLKRSKKWDTTARYLQRMRRHPNLPLRLQFLTGRRSASTGPHRWWTTLFKKPPIPFPFPPNPDEPAATPMAATSSIVTCIALLLRARRCLALNRWDREAWAVVVVLGIRRLRPLVTVTVRKVVRLVLQHQIWWWNHWSWSASWRRIRFVSRINNAHALSSEIQLDKIHEEGNWTNESFLL